MTNRTPHVTMSRHYHDVPVMVRSDGEFYWIRAGVAGDEVCLFMTRDAMETLYHQMWVVLYPELQPKEVAHG